MDKRHLLPASSATVPPSSLAAFAAFATLSLLGCSHGGGGGTPLFAKSYGGDGVDYAADAIETPDGGYVFVGARNVRTVGEHVVDSDLWATKTDAYGDLEWSRVYSQNLVDVGTASDQYSYTIATERRGGGFYLVGTVDSLGPVEDDLDTPTDVGVTRLDASGNPLWAQNFGFASVPTYPLLSAELTPSEEPLAVHPTADGGLLVAGLSRARILLDGAELDVPMAFAMRIDQSGSIDWQRHLDGEGYELAGSSQGTMFLAETSDAGVIVGVSGEFDPDDLGKTEGSDATRITRFDSLGQEVWSRRIDDALLEDLRVIDPAGPATDAVLLAVFDVDVLSTPDPELLLLDGNGNEIEHEDVDSELYNVGMAAANTSDATGEDVFLALGSQGSAFGSQVFRASFYDEAFGATANVEYPSLFDPLTMRAYDDLTQGFEWLGSKFFDVSAGLGSIVRVRADLTGAPVEFTDLPIAVEAVHGRRLSRGRVPAGWVDGSTNIWTWRPVNADDFGKGFVLAVHDDAGELWSRTFTGEFETRIEHALQVEVLPHAKDPEQFELIVLGETVFDPLSNPPAPGTPRSPWLLRLDQDGNLLTQRVLNGATLSGEPWSYNEENALLRSPARVIGGGSAQLLAVAANGDLLLGLEVASRPRIVRTDRFANVLSISEPVLPRDFPITSVAAAANGDALVAGAWHAARVDPAGALVWLKSTFRVSSVCELADQTIALGFTNETGFVVTAYGVAHLAADGSFLATRYANNFDFGVHSGETHVVPRADGGVWLGVQMHLPYSGFVDDDFPPATWVQQVIALDANFEALWSQTYGGLLDETVGGFHGTSDGGLLLSGNSRSLADSPEAWLLRLDSSGEIEQGCAAAITRHEPLGGSLIEGAEYSTDTTADGDPGTASITVFDTNSVATTVTGEIVVARQCSGKTNEKPPEGFALLQVVVDSGSGQVIELTDGAEPLIDCGATCEAFVPIGSTVELYAAPDDGFGLPFWTGTDCGGAASDQCSVTVTEDTLVTVSFPTIGGSELFDLTVVFAGTGSGTVSISPVGAICSDTCTQVDVASSGQTLNIVATPDSGSSFGGWSGADLVDGNFCSVFFTDSDRTVTVTFD